MKTRTKRVDHPGEGDPWPPGTVVYGRRLHWRVVASEPMDSPKWPWRWKYTVEDLGPHTCEFDALAANGVPTLVGYRKGEGPVDVFGPPS